MVDDRSKWRTIRCSISERATERNGLLGISLHGFVDMRVSNIQYTMSRGPIEDARCTDSPHLFRPARNSGISHNSESSTAPEDLTWDEWGPHHTRCFVDNGGHLSGTSGCRLFYSQRIVMDYNELDISRDRCCIGNLVRLKSRELQMQMHDKDLAEAVTEVAAEVSADPGRRIVLKSSVIRGVFTQRT
ncbi:hypothetical protein BC629DRAFT_1442252 [Irpex lacteus]|nr:hypothetical protein BC629DRAFT_1442252 [Irpex lacteus]